MSRELEELHRAANRMYAARSLEDCYEITIEAAVDVLGMDWCSLVAPADDAELFEIKAISEEGGIEVGERPFGLDEGVAGYVYQNKETHCINDIAASKRAKPTDSSIQSALTVPVGDWGVFHAMSAEKHTFDSRDRNWAELLCMSLGTVIERHNREERLRLKNERLMQLSSVLSHDLRNPLQIAQSRLELARDEPEPHLDAIEDAHSQMAELIDELLAMIRSDMTKFELETVSLRETVDSCWEQIDTGSAVLDIQTNQLINADRRRLRQLTENLLTNALTHGGDGVKITVGGTQDGFFVADDGPGIQPEMYDKVFEIGHTTAADGTGFGLNIVQEFATAHGWEVTVSESEYGGARFDITGVEFVEQSD